jgi:pimeloyl-ACP methyl ester carboxylesterase
MIGENRSQKNAYIENNKTYYYWTIGNKKNKPLLIIPGYTGTHSDFLHMGKRLSDTYYVIIPDLPGWGHSDLLQEELTITNYALFLKRLLNSLQVGTFSVLAHCMGAVIAMEYAYHYPQDIEKLVLISVPYEDGKLSTLFFRELIDISLKLPVFMRPLMFFWRNRLLAGFAGFFVLKFKNINKTISFIKKSIKNQPLQIERAVEENWASCLTYDFSRVAIIQNTIYLLHGAQDIIVPPKQVEKLKINFLPRAEVFYIKEAGHIPPVETPEIVISKTREYLI